MRALLSVYDKEGLVELAQGLSDLGWELVASGNTAAALSEAGIAHVGVAEVTGSPEMLGGRVKTLHPKIHGGILANRDDPGHLADLEAQAITPIDLVVSNLYLFSSDPSIELIDVGGPTMVRAAAKNHAHVGIVTSPADYPVVLAELRTSGSLSAATRRRLARAAFAHTAGYDAAIVAWLDGGGPGPVEGADPDEASLGSVLPPTLHLTLERTEVLRYGENPHQRGSRYRTAGTTSWWDSVVQHGGKELSYLNLFDGDAAWRLVHELAGDAGLPAVAIIKHANPCGAAVAEDLVTAYERALECDVQSAFGGVVAIGGVVTDSVADAIAAGPQADVIIAAGYEPAALGEADQPAQGDPPVVRTRARTCRSPAAQPGLERPGAGPRRLRHAPQRLAGRDRPPAHRGGVAGPGLGLAGLRADDVERHRHRQRRPGGRGGRRAAVACGGGRDRGGQGGRALRVARAPAMPSSPFPTASSSWPMPGSPPWCSPAAR